MSHISLHRLSIIFVIISFVILNNGVRNVASRNMENELCGNSSDNVEQGICWKLQQPLHLKPNDSCEISRITDVTSNEVNGTDEEETFVIDPCMREENRNFMECVLDHVPGITEDDPRYNKGRCQCYRNWYQKDFGRPAYNHTMDPEKDAKDWFVYSSESEECIVKAREPCAPTVSISAPYRCQPTLHGGKRVDGKCYEIGPDPRFKICTNGKGHERGGVAFIISLFVLLATFVF